MSRIVVATRSAHKLGEIRALLGLHAPDVDAVDLVAAGVPVSPEEDHLEVHDTFAANALAKARYFAERAGRAVLADDSGLCVDALGGAPGVRSKRFSGRSDLSGEALDRANNDLLLARLVGVPPAGRGAHYHCSVALALPDGTSATFEGRCDGLILEAPRGSGGFGYDPLFYLPAESATFGEIPAGRKNELSHRARAVHAAAPTLARWADGARPPR